MPTQLPSLLLDNQTHLQSLQYAAKVYACANSLFFKQPTSTGFYPTQVPFCLFPSPFPRDQFEKAIRLQTSYNRLSLNIASSPQLIKEVLGKSISKVDPFVGRLYELREKLQAQQSNDEVRVSLGIFRNDYLLHQSTPSSPLEIKQIELNTISVSFGSLATKVSGLHRYLSGLTPAFNQLQLPPTHNEALQSISKALRMAHEHYISMQVPTEPPVILMIVKANERNIFDQLLIEYELSSKQEPIQMIRVSCHEILQKTSLHPPTKKLFYMDSQIKAEVSVVYYRSMYGPEDFISEDDWNGRYQLESSRAINCPDFSMQLVGCKKFQQVLTESKFIERHRKVLMEGITESEWNEIQSTWTSIYSLDDPEGLDIAIDPNQAIDFVLKPQREGGGHNVYGLNIPQFVQSLSESERKAYILMKLIKPPKLVFNYLIRSPSHENDNKTTAQVNQTITDSDDLNILNPTEVVCELGIFGFCLLQYNNLSGNHNNYNLTQTDELSDNKILFNFQSGHLLRTKSSDADEGGLAIGISCLDSPLII